MMYKIISRTLILITALFLVTSIEVSALTFFDNEAIFNNICPVLAVEDFEDTNVPLNSVFLCPNSFNSLTNNGCYSPGALIPGFSISVVNPNNPPQALAVATPNFAGLTNVAVGAADSNNLTVITFTEFVKAVGMVLVAPNSSTVVDVQVFGVGNVFLGAAPVNLTPLNATFLGVVAEGPITRIELVEIGGANQTEFLYELSFGSCGLASPIPTLNQWGLIAMAGILGIIGFMVIRRRKVAA